MARASVAYGILAILAAWAASRLAAPGAGGVSALVFLLIVGYPLTLAAAWARSARDPGRESDAAVEGPIPVLRAPDAMSVAFGLAGAAAVGFAAWLGLGGGSVNGESGPSPPAPEPRVVVLPLIDLDGRGDRYFADGMTAEIQSGLAMVDGLEVRGRGSAATFVDVNRDATELGARLGGAAVLDGTVRRRGGAVRLNVRLLDVATGREVWATSVEGPLDRVFGLRDSLVVGVATALGLEPVGATRGRLAQRRTAKEAMDLYLLGRFRWAAGSRGDLAEAMSYYHLAIAADSGFVPAWVALAEAYATLPRFTRFPAERSRTEGAAAARTALRLQPDAPDAHAVLGELLMLYERDWPGARSHFDRAIELDPGDARPRALACELDLYTDRLASAREACAAALARDPFAFQSGWLLAGIERADGDVARSVARLDSLAELFPDYEPLLGDLAVVRLLAQAADGADTAVVAAAAAARAWLTLLGAVAVDSLAAELVERGSAPAAVAEIERRLGPDPAHLAALWALAGDEDNGAAAMRTALDERVPTALRFGVFPEYAALRSREDAATMLEEADLPVR